MRKKNKNRTYDKKQKFIFVMVNQIKNTLCGRTAD